MAAPALHFNIGLPDVKWYPPDVEAVKGSQMLAGLGRQGLTYPIQVVVSRKDHGPILESAGVRKLLSLSRTLHADPRVGTVIGPVDLRDDLKPIHYAVMYAKPERAIAKYPQIGQLFLSTDRQMAYMQVLPSEKATLGSAKGLARELRAASDDTFDVRVGGMVATNLDYEYRLKGALPWLVATVFGVTGLLLFAVFRSVMVPLKAIALNLLAVSAAIGATVAVFQDGFAHSLVGMAGGMGALPMMVPLLVFCLTFGLSMDYELFMLTRVREERATAPDEATAIARGLLATGSVITAAAAIMVLVFGAFVTADMIFVKLLGFGLAVAIGLEATVIRVVLAPALLNIAGRWNWWPGEK
jgi:RND superfamily putative drug exporter